MGTDHTDDHTPEVADFDAWRESASRRRSRKRPQVRIAGQVVPAPTPGTVSMRLLADMRSASDDTPADEFRRIIAELYGETTFDRWVEAGLTIEDLLVILGWSYARANDPLTTITFDEVAASYERARESNGETEGKGGNRATRRANTGRSSSRTSAASTASPPKRSRT